MRERSTRELEHRLRDGLNGSEPPSPSLERSVLAAIGDRTPGQLVQEIRDRELVRATLVGSALWVTLAVLVLFVQSRTPESESADSAFERAAFEEAASAEAMVGLYQWVDSSSHQGLDGNADERRVLTRVLVGERSP